MIQQISLDHGWYYFYRVHTNKLDKLPRNFLKLKNYLMEMLENCPDDNFKNGPRSSKLKLNLGIDSVQVDNHPISTLAEHGLNEMDNYKTAHSKVQVFMLHNDPQTIAVETPIWIENKELNFFKESNPLSGHIDILRMEDNKIWVWDYKPNAHREKYATTQTYFYALMLSQRTNIPLKHFMCGYFDENNTYIFKPEVNLIKNVELVKQ